MTFRFCILTWKWLSYPQNGYWGCSQLPRSQSRHNSLETKQLSKQWVSVGNLASKMAKLGLSAKKNHSAMFLASTRYNEHRVLSKGKNNQRLSVNTMKVHSFVVAVEKIHELVYELFPNPPYSSDFAPSDCLLFPSLKKWLCWKRCSFNYKIIV